MTQTDLPIWIKIHTGLTNDPRHRERMGIRIWYYMWLVGACDWDTGVISGYTDARAAEALDAPASTIRKWRTGLADEGYIKVEQAFQSLKITITRWRNPRIVNAPQINVPGNPDSWCPELVTIRDDSGGGCPDLDTHAASKVGTLPYRSDSFSQHTDDLPSLPQEKTTTVINIAEAPDGWQDDDQYVYIGRANGYRKLRRSLWYNPFKIDTARKKHDGSRDEVIAKFEIMLAKTPELLAAIPNLVGKRLVCYCAPEACHGDVLAHYANSYASGEWTPPAVAARIAHTKQELDDAFDAIAEAWRLSNKAAIVARIRQQLLGQIDGQDAIYNISPPALANEIVKFGRWYIHACAGCTMPLKREAIQSWFLKFREEEALRSATKNRAELESSASERYGYARPDDFWGAEDG